VRFSSVDAVWSMEHLLGPDSLAELWTFFPDPWQKKKHHKRRLVTPAFAALAATRLRPGAWWRLATDWADYAEQMLEVLDAEPRLEGGVVPRWEERPITKFERRGLAAGRAITDLAYRRV
jgi:tRNA (guanine-N7-)-methyltransferase